ncbi:hypothetical protein LCGC14_2139640, partial [marine sediment metagenome]
MGQVFQIINDAVANGMDYVLGWIMYLPRDVRIILVAVATSAILVFVRYLSTDQEWLKRADADQKRLGRLLKQAKRARDKDAKTRHKQTITLIKVKSLKFEGKPLLYAIVPIALLATWCFTRLGFEPPRVGETVELRMFAPNAAIGQHPYLVPEDGLTVEDARWIQEIVKDTKVEPVGVWDTCNDKISSWVRKTLRLKTPPLEGVARWRIKATGTRSEYDLKIRYKDRTYVKKFVVGGRRY